MHGEREPHLGIVLLPFIDAQRLIDAERSRQCCQYLNEEEKSRNSFGTICVYVSSQHIHNDKGYDTVNNEILVTRENYDIQPGDAFEAKLIPGTKSWLPGFEDSVQGAHGHQPKYKQGHRQSVAATSMPTCKFHVLGTCDKGFNCRFSHSLGDRNVGGISTGSNDETASSNATKLPIITDEMLEEWCENG